MKCYIKDNPLSEVANRIGICVGLFQVIYGTRLLWKYPPSLLSILVTHYIVDFASCFFHRFSADRASNRPIALQVWLTKTQVFDPHHDCPANIVHRKIGHIVLEGIPALPILMLLKKYSSLFVWGSLVAHTHKWAHMRNHRPDDLPRWIKWMQDRHIFLSNTTHRIHHNPTTMFSSNHALLSGVANPFFNKIMRCWDTKGIFATGFPSTGIKQHDDPEVLQELTRQNCLGWE